MLIRSSPIGFFNKSGRKKDINKENLVKEKTAQVEKYQK